MNTYEFTFIVQDDKEAQTLKEMLKSLEGTILKEDPWGERTLAYPINKLTKAKYFSWTIKLDSKNLGEFRKRLNFNENLMRFLLLRTDEQQETGKESKN